MNLFHFTHAKPVKNSLTSTPQKFLLRGPSYFFAPSEISQHSKLRAPSLYVKESLIKKSVAISTLNDDFQYNDSIAIKQNCVNAKRSINDVTAMSTHSA